MNPLQWFRLVLDELGKVNSCEPVEDGGTSSLTVFYVQARTTKEAARKAYNLQCKLRLRATRARLEAEGKCRCGRERDRRGFKRCSFCSARSTLYHERQEAKRRGQAVPSLSVRETRHARRKQETASLEYSVLLEVEAATEACRTMGEFRRWLRARIVSADRKGRAA